MDDIAAIKEQVPMYKVLQHYGVQFAGEGFPEQLHCSFHSPDINRSARVYPDTNTVYCWVCDKAWDVIAFVADKEEVSVGQAVVLLKKWYDVKVVIPDYERKLYAEMHKNSIEAGDFSEVVERLFIDFVNNLLTHGEFSSILNEYNLCWAVKDDLEENGAVDSDRLQKWLSVSKAKIREGVGHG